ncbi:MAG: alpha/beta hydrolase [Solirubrobacteraceae bacterium]
MADFAYEGYRLNYTMHGDGPDTTVLLPGLLLPQTMQFPLARQLARLGQRVITMDPLGHGRSDRPVEMWNYSMGDFALQTIALLDHLELERAVVGGTSLGANITLEVASRASERLQGMVIEMPVLDHAIAACGAAFTPLLFALKFGGPVFGPMARVAGAVPRGPLPFMAKVGLDWIAQDPAPSASVLSGILYGRVAPAHTERVTFRAPTLIIGHPRDPVHPFSDAGMLAQELPNARLVHASSILELRLRPERLTAEIAAFVADCWAAPAAGARPAPRRRRTRAAASG